MADQYGHDDDCGCHAAAPPRGQRADVDNSTWDGPAAMSACTASDQPASCFNAICAGKKAGDPATQAAHALPHHKHPGDPPNANGVRNALAQLPKTDGLTNAAQAKSHLEAHLNAINATGANSLARPHLARAEGYKGDRHGPTVERARVMPAPAHFKRESVLINGKSMEQLDGYASVTGVEYEMWDMWGPYGEKVAPTAFDKTLGANPDVAFLINHRGLTLARTSAGTLTLDADPRGLHSLAYVNPDRMDVRDLLIAIDDHAVTEMSFAFMLTDGSWDEEFEHFEITEVDIDRGDVSAVNFGANPYTSIGARAREIMSDLMSLPPGAQRAAFERLAARFGEGLPRRDLTSSVPAAVAAAVTADPEQRSYGTGDVRPDPAAGMSLGYVEAMLDAG
jgi:HK97 family phage prohead protease